MIKNLSKKKRVSIKRIWPLILMMLPGVAYLVINNYLPMYGITIAFRELDFSIGVFQSPFNGIENFKFLFATGIIWTAVRNTVLYNAVFLILGLVVPVTVAILFSTVANKFAKRIYQTTVLLPHLMSWVVVASFVFAFFSNESGLINGIITTLGGKKIDFYYETKYWPFILTFFHMWKGVGFSLVLYLSSILGISDEYYEAAKLDGATFWQQVRYITLPHLKSIMIMMFTMSISKIFYSDFGLFQLLPANNGALYDVTMTIDTYIFNALKGNGDIANSSAASVAQSLLGFVLILVTNTIIRKIDKESAMF